MSPGLRKLTLTAHVTFSIGWIGAVGAFLALSVAGLTSHDADVVRGAYLSMELIGKFVILPMCFVALATGLIEGLGTPGGLFRHYWVVVKLVLTLIATFLLLVHENVMVLAAKWVSGAAATQLFAADFGPLKTELMQKSALAIVLLLSIATLGVYKPWGLTTYGRRKLQERLQGGQQSEHATPLGVWLFYAAAAVVMVLFVVLVLHLTGHGLGGHHH